MYSDVAQLINEMILSILYLRCAWGARVVLYIMWTLSILYLRCN